MKRPRKEESRRAPAKTGPSKTGPSKTGPSKTGPSKTGPSKAGPSKTGPSKAGPSKAGPSRAGPSRQAPARQPAAKPARERAARLSAEAMVAGRHPVRALLESDPSRARRLHVLKGTPGLDDLVHLARSAGIEVISADRDRLDELAGPDLVHQGAILETSRHPYVDLEDALERGADLVLVLDGIEDPRNLGAAARAAFTLGASLLVIPARRAAPVTAAAHKTAAGALALLDVAQVDNLNRALERLKEAGFWLVGAEADAERAPWDVDIKGKIALVIGGEDRGLRRLTREACDFVVSIPMAAAGFSLNAADAATVLLYEVLRQRRGGG